MPVNLMAILFITTNVAEIQKKYPLGMSRSECVVETARGNGCIAAVSLKGKPFVSPIICAHVIKQRSPRALYTYRPASSHRTKWLQLRRLGIAYRPRRNGVRKSSRVRSVPTRIDL